MTAKYAMVFPGQGSQYVGMLDALAGSSPVIRETFQEASDRLGFDLWQMTQESEEHLNRTENTQPALLSASVALWRLWQAGGNSAPSAFAGHSLGEYSALVCAGALDFGDAVRLVASRGRFMQDAVAPGEGSMAAVLGLDDDRITAICNDISAETVVAPANFNAPGQVVIAGHAEAVDKAVTSAKSAGAKRVVKLPVSVPSHCALMRPAAKQLAELLENINIRTPVIPVIHNVDARTRQDPKEILQALIEQLYEPVQWTRCVRALTADGVSHLLECGPGKVLGGLCKRIDRNLLCQPMSEPGDIDKARAAVEEEKS
jgi:[acyl-carrier-protein] S-malonyltransferase